MHLVKEKNARKWSIPSIREVVRKNTAAEGQRKDCSVLGEVRGKSEAEGPFFHVRMTHNRGDTVIHLFRVGSQSSELV